MRKAEGSFQRPDTPEANSLIPVCYDELFKIPVYKSMPIAFVPTGQARDGRAGGNLLRSGATPADIWLRCNLDPALLLALGLLALTVGRNSAGGRATAVLAVALVSRGRSSVMSG